MFEFGMQIAFDLLGMFAFATSGALMAIRKDFDAIGILLLAELTATGGGARSHYWRNATGCVHESVVLGGAGRRSNRYVLRPLGP
jgi:hypothetical protein